MDFTPLGRFWRREQYTDRWYYVKPTRVYCFIPRADLQKRDFSNVYFELQEIN